MDLKQIKLALSKLLKLEYQSVSTDNGDLYYEDELVEGTAVFSQDSEGNYVPAENGKYIVSEEVIEVEGGLVVSITANTEEAPAEGTETEMEDESPVETPVDEAPKEAEYVTVEEFNKLVELVNSLLPVVEEVIADVAEVKEEVELVDTEFKKATKKSVAKTATKEIEVKDVNYNDKTDKFFNGWKK